MFQCQRPRLACVFQSYIRKIANIVIRVTTYFGNYAFTSCIFDALVGKRASLRLNSNVGSWYAVERYFRFLQGIAGFRYEYIYQIMRDVFRGVLSG